MEHMDARIGIHSGQNAFHLPYDEALAPCRRKNSGNPGRFSAVKFIAITFETIMSKLVIVESPAKAKTIQKFLPKDFVVRASLGHIRDLPDNAGQMPEKYR